MDPSISVQQPYFVYLLESLGRRCKNHAYVGSTPNPPRRIRQHNGEIQGGAMKTTRKRPWDMVAVVHGFTNKYAGLQFEWAWQNPHLSRHFKEASLNYTGGRADSMLPKKLRVLAEMLSLAHWARWPLGVHFTSDRVAKMFKQEILAVPLPLHVRVSVGPLTEVPGLLDPEEESIVRDFHATKLDEVLLSDQNGCCLCGDHIDLESPQDWLCCASETCPMIVHIECLSDRFLSAEEDSNHLLPVSGECPLCAIDLIWGNLIASAHGRIDAWRARQLPSTNNKPAASKARLENDGEVDFSDEDVEWVGGGSSGATATLQRAGKKGVGIRASQGTENGERRRRGGATRDQVAKATESAFDAAKERHRPSVICIDVPDDLDQRFRRLRIGGDKY
ncbi:hypothetical protein BJ742DRAFT_498527 [Cladochytrium replicatum]|nr:hypothetical protein BJ742DRAFT_498527 [Cladochytrium replicatum]